MQAKKLADITLEEISAEIMSGPSEPLDDGTSAVKIAENTLEEDVPPELDNLVEEADLQEEEEEETTLGRKKTSSSTRIKWTEAELEEVKKYFRENLNTHTTPGRITCNMAIEKSRANGGSIQYRPWETLKKKVWNLIQKQK